MRSITLPREILLCTFAGPVAVNVRCLSALTFCVLLAKFAKSIIDYLITKAAFSVQTQTQDVMDLSNPFCLQDNVAQ